MITDRDRYRVQRENARLRARLHQAQMALTMLALVLAGIIASAAAGMR